MSQMTRCIFAASGMAVLFAAIPAQAQENAEAVKRVIESARRTNPALNVRTDSITGMPASVRGLRPKVDPRISLGVSRDAAGQPSDADIAKAAELFFRTGALAAAYAAKNRRVTVQALRVRRDPDIPGQSVVHVRQQVDGVPVFGSSGRVLMGPSLAVTQLTTTFSTVAIEGTTPDIGKERAIQVARERLRTHLKKRSSDRSLDRLRDSIDAARTSASLVVFDPALVRSKRSKPGPARLSWMAMVDSYRFFVDAKSADVLFFYRDQRWAVLRQVFDLETRQVFPGTKVLDDLSGDRREPLAPDAKHAYVNAGHVAEFYARRFGRHGLLEREDTEVLAAYVRYGKLKNAYWCTHQSFYCPRADAMVYGTAMPSAVDIVAHEMTHGVISVEANLSYVNESGAVNEALADIFGTLIEFDVTPRTANWVLGDKIPGYSVTTPLRNMADPNLSDMDGNSLFDRHKGFGSSNHGQPDHYSDYVQADDPLCATTRDTDNGCVHFNSGIFNKFAFLVAEGGRQRGLVVKGIGREKMGRIAYRALIAHLNPSSGLKESARAFYDACGELSQLRTIGMTAEDCNKVRDAQYAVGLADASS